MKYLATCILLALVCLSCSSETQTHRDHKSVHQPGDEATPITSSEEVSAIDFMATGSEPAWTLQVDFDKMLWLRTVTGDSIEVSVPEPNIIGKEEKYIVETTAGSLQVSITEEPCKDNMSGEDFSHTVSVIINKKEYQGCGNYLKKNDMAYEGQWVLISLNGKSFSKHKTQKVPMLEIKGDERVVTGHTGCNRLNGQLKVEGDQINFGNITTTRMACPESSEQEFLQAINTINSYKVEANQLILKENEEERLVFEKIQ